MKKLGLLLLFSMPLVIFTGCQSRVFRAEVEGYSVESRPIFMHTFGSGKENVLIIATIHGSEPAGEPLARELMAYMEKHPGFSCKHKVTVIPVANPDGLTRSHRGNRNGIDLNRNFPAENRVNSPRYGQQALSEPESQVLYELINRLKPVWVISIHQPLACIDYDGPGESLANAMALRCDLPVKKLGSLPGSLGSWVGNELGVPIMTLELRKEDSELSGSALWAKYGPALLAALQY
ncbi:MAG: succinylglutamate desuccinylase/aspartoacylase family protein [Sedimentisphaerales bacterium]|nr:succinylglutamate desuccinylase/aspartoacylase family protein [Sedimentisphaerales bacterium]